MDAAGIQSEGFFQAGSQEFRCILGAHFAAIAATNEQQSLRRRPQGVMNQVRFSELAGEITAAQQLTQGLLSRNVDQAGLVTESALAPDDNHQAV